MGNSAFLGRKRNLGIDGKILEAEQKMYESFRRVRGLGYMTVSEMLGGNAGE